MHSGPVLWCRGRDSLADTDLCLQLRKSCSEWRGQGLGVCMWVWVGGRGTMLFKSFWTITDMFLKLKWSKKKGTYMHLNEILSKGHVGERSPLYVWMQAFDYYLYMKSCVHIHFQAMNQYYARELKSSSIIDLFLPPLSGQVSKYTEADILHLEAFRKALSFSKKPCSRLFHFYFLASTGAR